MPTPSTVQLAAITTGTGREPTSADPPPVPSPQPPRPRPTTAHPTRAGQPIRPASRAARGGSTRWAGAASRRSAAGRRQCSRADTWAEEPFHGWLPYGPHGACPRRHQRVPLPALAERALPAGAGHRTLARALREPLRDPGAQHHLLPSHHTGGGRALAPDHPARLRLRRQGEPVHHPHEEAEGPGPGSGALLRPTRTPPAEARRRPLAAAAPIRRRCAPPARCVPRRAAGWGAVRGRVPGAELV